MMFSYYGSKSKIIDKYPAPIYDTIIEPFAGSARYALKYWDKDVILIDKYDVIVKIWKYLQKATTKDVESLPELNRGDKVPEYLCEEERLLLGFAMNPGSSRPKVTYSDRAAKGKEISRHKKRIIENLDKIRHWDIRLGSYEELEERERVTIFVDPPYQKAGKYYTENSVDYDRLGLWCKKFAGLGNQIIVCENEGADWLDFRYLCDLQGSKKKSTEVVWTNVV